MEVPLAYFPKDNPKDRAAFYGDPALGQVAKQLVWYNPPFKMTYEGKPINAKGFQFHVKAVKQLDQAFQRIWKECNFDQKTVDKHGLSDFCGSYVHRKIRGRENERDAWSSHAYGAAIDIHADGNELGNKHGNMPAFAVAAFEDAGFRWGGRYTKRQDWMHFEGVDNGRQITTPIATPATPVEVKPAPTPVANTPAPAAKPGWLGALINAVAGAFKKKA
jgi:hypothetical protein